MNDKRINVDYMTTTVPLSKKNITFEKVDGEKVFDLCMEIDNLQQENTELKAKLSSIETFIKIQKEIITEQPSKNKTTDDYFLKKLENILEILRGNNNVKN